MFCWRIVIALLMLSQLVIADEELTAEQVVQRWVKEQREHPVSQVKFSWIDRDRVFRSQTNRLGELTYTTETSGQYRIIPWPSTMKPPAVWRGYELREDESISDMSWNESTVFFRDNDGTVQEFSRPCRCPFPWSDPIDFVEEGLPPVFPGLVSESRIAKFDWSIMKREPGSIWLRGIPNAKDAQKKLVPTWDVSIATDSWQVRAVRRIYGEKETVMVIIRD